MKINTNDNTRKKLRNQNHDYTTSCIYFVTVCVDFFVECFGDVIDVSERRDDDADGENERDGLDRPLRANQETTAMRLNEYGEIVERQWLWLAEQYPYVTLDEYIVMPNHFHAIIIITNANDRILTSHVGDGRDRPAHPDDHQPANVKSLSQLIGAFKTTSSKRIHRAGLIDFAWQRSFHDRMIRNAYGLDNIQTYIKNNPAKWDSDPMCKQGKK